MMVAPVGAAEGLTGSAGDPPCPHHMRTMDGDDHQQESHCGVCDCGTHDVTPAIGFGKHVWLARPSGLQITGSQSPRRLVHQETVPVRRDYDRLLKPPRRIA